MERIRIRLSACAAAALLAAGCATPVPPAHKAPPVREQISIQSFSDNPFLSVALPQSRIHSHEEAVRALGRPAQTLIQDAPSQHDPTIINSLITLRYAFGDLVYLHVRDKDVENLILIRLHGNQLPLKYGVRFGQTTREEIQKLFGPPQDVQENSYSYSVRYTQEITNLTTFYFRDSALLEVDISSLMMD